MAPGAQVASVACQLLSGGSGEGLAELAPALGMLPTIVSLGPIMAGQASSGQMGGGWKSRFWL